MYGAEKPKVIVYCANVFLHSAVVPTYVEEEFETGPTITIVEDCPDDGEDDREIIEIEEIEIVDEHSDYKHEKTKRKHPNKKKSTHRSLNAVSPRFGGWFGANKKPTSNGNTCKIVSGWRCPRRFGKHAHPVDCQKFVQCNFRGENTVHKCPDDQAYDKRSKGCSSDWSSCEALNECLYDHELLEDPSDEASYFICIQRQRIFKRRWFSAYHRRCAHGRIFDLDYQRCVTKEHLYTTSALDPYKRRKPNSSIKKKKTDKKKTKPTKKKVYQKKGEKTTKKPNKTKPNKTTTTVKKKKDSSKNTHYRSRWQ